jgi:hypothetical protein
MCAAGYQRTGFTTAGHAVCSACTLGLTYATSSMQDCEGLSGCPKGKGAKPSLSHYSTASDTTSRYCHDCSADTVYSKYNDLSACQDHDPCPAGQGVSRTSVLFLISTTAPVKPAAAAGTHPPMPSTGAGPRLRPTPRLPPLHPLSSVPTTTTPVARSPTLLPPAPRLQLTRATAAPAVLGK